jgi:hypothetical protein
MFNDLINYLKTFNLEFYNADADNNSLGHFSAAYIKLLDNTRATLAILYPEKILIFPLNFRHDLFDNTESFLIESPDYPVQFYYKDYSLNHIKSVIDNYYSLAIKNYKQLLINDKLINLNKDFT